MLRLLCLSVITVILSICLGCSTVLDERIESSTIEETIPRIIEEYPDMDSLKQKILVDIKMIHKGRDAYIEYREENNETGLNYDAAIVEEDKFNSEKEDLFNYFEANEITYKQLLAELDSFQAIEDKYEVAAQDIYKEIDEYCTQKQNEIDKQEEKADSIKTQLNEMVKIKVLSITEKERDYRDVVQVKIQMLNQTSKPIEAISFNVEIKDKLDNILANIGCRFNDRFVNSDIGYWIYDRWDHSDIYKALKNTKISHITTTYEINKINHGGEIISAYDLENFQVNFEYESPENLTGYCPYLDEDDPLNKKLQEINDKEEKEFDNTAVILNKYLETTGNLIDFKKLLDF